MAKELTPKQLAQFWAILPNKFEVNVFNFETLIGNAAKYIFKQSFYLGRFNSAGTTAWAPRTDYKTHPLLVETGSLRESISWRRVPGGRMRGVIVFTDQFSFKNSNRQYDRNFCYAAIHNEGGNSSKLKGVSGGARLIKQRQFIGHSTVLHDKIDKLSIRLFDGFHKS